MSVVAKLPSAPNGSVDPMLFGVANDGVGDDTMALRAAIEQAVTTDRALILQGRYRITGPLMSYREARNLSSLHVFCVNDVHIEVEKNAEPFGDVLYFHTRSACDFSITGGYLSVDGANRVGRGITIRHDARAGGKVSIISGLTLSNFHERGERELRENQALAVIGAFDSVDISHVNVDGVRRTNPKGATKGIAVAGYVGTARISDCTVKDVRVPSVGSADADGIAVFSKSPSDFYLSRSASAVIQRCTLIDCQGRSIKSQCSNTLVSDPVIRRQRAVSIRHSVEFDFQVGNGRVLNPTYHYLASDGRSPLGASHSCIAFQQLLKNEDMTSTTKGGQLHTEVPVPRYIAAIYREWSANSTIHIDGLRVMALGPLNGGAFARAVIEMDMGQVASNKSLSRIAASNITGSLLCPVVGYHSHDGQNVSERLAIDVSHCTNDAPGQPRRLFGNVSGGRIMCLTQFKASANRGFADSGLTCT